MLAVDTNVLVYAHRREAGEHPAAFELLRNLAEGNEPSVENPFDA
jgi:predicted nucleic acid-binding protein